MQNNSYSIASPWRRAAAFIYDCLLLIAIFFVVTAIALRWNNGEAITHPAYKFVLYAIGLLFFSGFWMNGGQTLGMRAWRIRLLGEDSRPITWISCVKRYLLATVFFGTGLLYAMFDRQRKAPQDRLSKTYIVKLIK